MALSKYHIVSHGLPMAFYLLAHLWLSGGLHHIFCQAGHHYKLAHHSIHVSYTLTFSFLFNQGPQFSNRCLLIFSRHSERVPSAHPLCLSSQALGYWNPYRQWAPPNQMQLELTFDLSDLTPLISLI